MKTVTSRKPTLQSTDGTITHNVDPLLAHPHRLRNIGVLLAIVVITGSGVWSAAPQISAFFGSSKLQRLPVITVIKTQDGNDLQILDLPVPESCHMTRNADFDGASVVWGLGHKVGSAAECCEKCRNYAGDKPCNVWVWCGDPSGVCWTMDIHKHTTGDCWLKFQEHWDNNTDISKSNLKINHLGTFPQAFREEHKTAPKLVPWVAGVIQHP